MAHFLGNRFGIQTAAVEVLLGAFKSMAAGNPMMSAAKSRASRLSVGKNSTMQSQSFSSCQYGSKSSLCFVPKIARSFSQSFG